MVKDPWWLYAYWEIQPDLERLARSHLLPEEVAGLRSVLRVHDVTEVTFPEQPAHRSFDIPLSGLATSWFIHTDAPGRSFLVDIGLLTRSGRFLLLARSNRVDAPRFGPSDVIDEAWVTTDELYWKLFGLAAGIGVGASPMARGQELSHALFSGAWSSAGLVRTSAPSIKGFWFRVDTDVVVHGATEPKATVKIQDQAVAVRKDGSFSLRVALPEGAQAIAVEVTSADGRQTRMVTPIVSLSWAGSLHPDPTKAMEPLSKPNPTSRASRQEAT